MLLKPQLMLISLDVLVVSSVPYNQARNTLTILTILRSSENYGTSWDSCLWVAKSTKPHPRTEFLWFRARHECHLRRTSHVKHLQKLQLPTNHQPSDCKAKILHPLQLLNFAASSWAHQKDCQTGNIMRFLSASHKVDQAPSVNPVSLS